MDNAEKEKICLYEIMARKKRRECFDYFKNYHEEDLGDNTALRISSDNDLMGKNAITSTIVTLEKKIVISGNKIKLFRSVFFWRRFNSN